MLAAEHRFCQRTASAHAKDRPTLRRCRSAAGGREAVIIFNFARAGRLASYLPIHMKRRSREASIGAGVVAFLLATVLSVLAAAAQQVTGELGSPSATVTIDGKQLPPPLPKFGGVIKESARDSKPWWPPRVVPPKGAPNVLLI